MFTSAELPRTPFVPWVFSHAARLEQMSIRGMITDPGQLAKALQNAQKLYKYDAIVNNFDSSLEAEACGCQVRWEDDYHLPTLSSFSGGGDICEMDLSNLDKRGRLPVVLEAMHRLKTVMGRTVAIVGVVTGPVTLAAKLSGSDITKKLEEDPEEAGQLLDFTGRVSLRICKAYCELQPDMIAVADDLLLKVSPQHFQKLTLLYSSLSNLIHFYDASFVLITRVEALRNLNFFTSLGLDGIVVGGRTDFGLMKEIAQKTNLVVGAGIPNATLLSTEEEIRKNIKKYVDTMGNRRYFLSTEEEVPYDFPPEKMHLLLQCL